MPDPSGPCSVYLRGIAYSDEYFFVDADPLLDGALRAWRATGDSAEVLSLLQHQEENSEAPDAAVSNHPSFAEAELAVRDVLVNTIRGLTFIDFGFVTFGIGTDGSSRWYSTADDDEAWSALLDDNSDEERPNDRARLMAWCDQHDWPRPVVGDRAQREGIANRSMEQFWLTFIEQEPDETDPFLADIVAEQLQAAGRDDLLIDLWNTLVGSLVFVGPNPSSKKYAFDLRRMSLFKERGIDTSGFSADSLDPQATAAWAQPQTRSAVNKPPESKGFLGRIFRR